MFLRENGTLALKLIVDVKTFSSVWDGTLPQLKPYQFINSLQNNSDSRSHAFITSY